MRKFLSALMILFAVNFAVASAEIINVKGEGRYVVDKKLKETFDDATEHARDEAMRSASESVGVIVKARSKAVDFKLTVDTIETYAVSLLEDVRKVDDFEKNSAGDLVFICKVTATVDTSKIDLEKFLGRDDLADKERLTRELREAREEIERLKAKGNVVQSEFDRKQNRFLVAKYERDLDIYDFDKKINLQDMMTTAEKLAAIDAGNVTAFRAKVFVYRQDADLQPFFNYCYEILDTSNSLELLIEACLQLGDWSYTIKDADIARGYVDKGIAIVKVNYTPAQIEELVNGTDVQMKDYQLIGRSNSIRELYILKSEIENCNPSFDYLAVTNDLILGVIKFYNIKYRTDW